MALGKTFSLLLIVMLAVSGLILIQPSFAQVGVTNPSIPNFSVALQTYSNYFPPTYGIDPSTGKAVMIKAGYTDVEKWVNVEIQGQPFVRYNNSADQLISLYYDVRWKGNRDTAWQSIPTNDGFEYFGDVGNSQSVGCLISIGFKGFKGPENSYMQLLDPNATQINFQVEALIGYYDTDNVFIGQSSGWSNTLTLAINGNSSTTSSGASTTPNPSVSPSQKPTSSSNQSAKNIGQFGLSWTDIAIIALLTIIAVLLITNLIYMRRKNNARTQVSPNV